MPGQVVAANREARKPGAVLDADGDTFLKNECRADKWLLLELSQVARVDTVRLAQARPAAALTGATRALTRRVLAAPFALAPRAASCGPARERTTQESRERTTQDSREGITQDKSAAADRARQVRAEGSGQGRGLRSRHDCMQAHVCPQGRLTGATARPRSSSCTPRAYATSRRWAARATRARMAPTTRAASPRPPGACWAASRPPMSRACRRALRPGPRPAGRSSALPAARSLQHGCRLHFCAGSA